MNKINKDNYEAWLLDFAEGNLSEEQQIELELFVMQHPELNINLSELPLLNIEVNSVFFQNKHQLKKSETDLVSDTQFIAYIENQLSYEEKKAIDKSCANNKFLAYELKLFQNTITYADTTVEFPSKNKLKRQNKVIWFNFSSSQYSIAASVLLLLGLYMFWPKQDYVGRSQEMAHNYTSQQFDVIPHKTKTLNLLAENKNSEKVISNKKQHSKTKSVIFNQVTMIAENEPKKQKALNAIPEPKNEIKLENKPLLAINETNVNQTENTSKAKTIVEVITESDEEVVVQAPKKKKSFWALAERALQNLNAMGVKSVNANQENSEKDNASTYALTLGKVSVTHKSN